MTLNLNEDKMDNLIIEKIWQEENCIELKIFAKCAFVKAYQMCYIQDEKLLEIAEKMLDYLKDYNEAVYLEFGKKTGNYTPAFSMCLLPADISGHVKIEVDLEIDDNNTRSHRCCYYINSELGLVEQFSKGLIELVKKPIGEKVELFYE